MREFILLIVLFYTASPLARAQVKNPELSREEALTLAKSIKGKALGKFWYEKGNKTGPYHHAGRVILEPFDHIAYQRSGDGVAWIMGDDDYWQTCLDFFTNPNGESTVMAHLFAPEVKPSRLERRKDERSTVQKALSPAALLAIESDDLEFLKLLIEKGLKVNEALEFKGNVTALYHVVRKRKPKIVKYLFSIGADPELRTSGERPIQLAIEWELKKIIPLLAQAPKEERLIEKFPEGLIDAIFARYFTEEIMFVSLNGENAPKAVVDFLKMRMPNIRPDSRLETLQDRPLGTHSWYRDKKDKGFGSRLEVTVKKVGKGWQVEFRDSVGPAMAGHGWESLFYKKLGYWLQKNESSWDE